MSKLLPVAAEIERAVLCEMLIDNEACAVAVGILNENCFYKSGYCVIFSAIKELYQQSSSVDVYSLVNYISDCGKLDIVGGEGSIIGISNETFSTANIFHHCQVLVEKAKLRGLLNLATLIETMCGESDKNSRLIIAEIETNLSAIIKNEVVKQQEEEIESW